MKTRNLLSCMLLAFATAGAAAQAQEATPAAAPVATTVPVTTSSALARNDYELGLVEREDRLFVDQGLEFMREAVKADPQFALGHAALGYFTADPKEEERESALAVKYMANATPDEQLLIRWMNGTKNGDLVPAISALNDLLAKYPNDKRLANMAAEWLCSNQGVFERGENILVTLLKNDPRYFPAMNNLAYCYALSGEAQHSPALMDQYVAALPNEPNPQDSYGEIMRILGNYPAALDHYQWALKINPNFNPSQVGVASTYALMGEQKRARAAYLVAIKGTKEKATQLNYRMLSALTYYRENENHLGRAEMTKLAAEAKTEGFRVQAAEMYRTMALFNADTEGALKDLEAARDALAETRDLPPGDRDNELASILQTRAFIGANAGKADVAEESLKLLETMAGDSRSMPVQKAYHSANGASLLAKGDYAAAIPELQEDAQNPLSLRLLAEAQSKAGQSADAAQSLNTLAAISDERVETAYAVPLARAEVKKETPQTASTGGH